MEEKQKDPLKVAFRRSNTALDCDPFYLFFNRSCRAFGSHFLLGLKKQNVYTPRQGISKNQF